MGVRTNKPSSNSKKAEVAAKPRCGWVTADPLYIKYHDEEWGVPVHDDRRHFEFLILEGAQAGLSWLTVLRKREGYRQAFAQFDPAKVAAFSEAKMARLLLDPSIVRNRLKVAAAVTNAQKFLQVQQEFGSFDRYCWEFVGGAPLRRYPRAQAQVPAISPESDRWSKDLRQRGFKFVGSTIIYAHMQATGMVDDHIATCFRAAKPGKSR